MGSLLSHTRSLYGKLMGKQWKQWETLFWGAPKWGDLSNPEIESTSHVSCIGRQALYQLRHLVQFSSVQQLSCVWLFATPWTAARQGSVSMTNSWSLLKLMSIESVMTSNQLILCCHLLLMPSIFPSLRVFSNESALRIKWPKYWSFSFISPYSEHLGLTDWISFQSKGLSRVFSNNTVQKYQFFGTQLSL